MVYKLAEHRILIRIPLRFHFWDQISEAHFKKK